MYVYQRINDGSRSISDTDQHPEVHLPGNNYNFTLICKESTKAHTYKTDFSFYNPIQIRLINSKR